MRLFSILVIAAFLVSCESTVDMSQLIYQNGQYLLKDSEAVFSGNVTGMEEGEIVDGIKQGIWTEFNRDGKLMAEGSYTDGYKTGPWKLYHKENGELWKQGAYDGKGLKTGEWTTFGKDGLLWEKGNFAKDRQEGAWEYYHLNGVVRAKGSMVLGKRDGVWIKYDEEGNEASRKTWNNGQQLE